MFTNEFIKDILLSLKQNNQARKNMKIKLLNGGGYSTNGKIDFPVIVEAVERNGSIYVSGSELTAIGFTWLVGRLDWPFSIGSHCEIVPAKTKLTWDDLFTMMSRDNGGRWTAGAGTPAAEYIDSNSYRTPSRSFPHSHSRPLLTVKFAKWLLANHPQDAEAYGITA